MALRTSLFPGGFIVVLFLLGCNAQKISINAKNIKVDNIQAIADHDGDRVLFARLVRPGVDYEAVFPSSTGSTGSTAFLALPEPAGNAVHIFELQLSYKDNDPFKSLSAIKLQEILHFTPGSIVLPTNLLANYDLEKLGTFSAVVNANAGRSFQLIPVVITDDSTGKGPYFYGIDVQRDSCELSSIEKIGAEQPLPTLYHEDRIKCLPDGFSGKLLTAVSNGGKTIFWFKPAAKKPAKDATVVHAMYDTLAKESFTYTCDPKSDFWINLYRNKNGDIKTIGVVDRATARKLLVNRQIPIAAGTYPLLNYTVNIQTSTPKDSTPATAVLKVWRDSSAIRLADTLLSLSLSANQGTYLKEAADVMDSVVLVPHFSRAHTVDSITFKAYGRPEFLDPYDAYFDVGSFERWLGDHYPDSKGVCAGAVAFAIHLRDSSYLRCVLCKPGGRPDTAGATAATASAAAKKDTSGNSKNKNHLTKPGSVSIVPSRPYIMTPSTINQYIPIDLQLSGDYDSSACKVPFSMAAHDLANHLRPAGDSTITISKQDWDSAIDLRHGRMRVELQMKFDSTVDSLAREQEDYIVINDTVKMGRKVVRLMNFNPATAFWLEVGSNFELLNGLAPKNIYGGIILFEKDAAVWHPLGLTLNFSFIGGAYESLTTSSAGSSDSGILYRDNTSYTLNTANNGYPVYRDTGYMTVTSSTRNVGLFFEPVIRLTNLPTNHNGAHLFAGLYNELLWQTVTTSNDYSHLARDSSIISYVPSTRALYGFHFRQNSSVTTDYFPSYIGLGIPFYLKKNAYTFFLNPVFGFTNQEFSPIRANADPHKLSEVYRFPLDSANSGYPVAYLEPRCSWNPFYLVQFRFNEEKYDITITGEIRMLLLRNSSPLLTLTISKKFDLASLIKSVVSPASKPSN